MYSPALGRFLQRDPLGYYDSMNLFEYVGNNPGNFVDPWGLWEWGPTNLGWQFLHESNPVNPNSTMRQQMQSWVDFYRGDWASAAASSGQSVVEKTNKKGETSAWQKWYWGTQIAAATAVTTAIVVEPVTDILYFLNHNRYLRIGPGRKGGQWVVRIAGEWLKKLTGISKIDLWKGGPL